MKAEYNLKNMKKRPKKAADPDALKTSIHLRLDAIVVGDIKVEAERMGIPYQTLINSILHRFVTGELVDKKNSDKKAS
jgi:predicted DNA binding CopG/RHH family protein